MIEKVIGLAAFALLLGFMGVLIGFVPDPELVAVIAVVMVLAGYDFYRSLFMGRNGGG